jgi:tRNA (uracil-5-)-methyltransferase TRM9
MIGLDRSRNLLQIARYAGSQSTGDLSSAPAIINEVVQADVLNECWRAGIFVRFAVFSLPVQLNDLKQDYAISIATIHHLATEERRKIAVQVLFIFTFSDRTAL